MKIRKLTGLGLVLGASMVSNTASATAITDIFQNVYFGVDESIRHVRFESGFGDGMFNNTYLQTNIAFGVKFNEYFGIEIGYEWTHKRNKPARMSKGDKVFGEALENVKEDWNNSFQAEGVHVNLVGFYPISEGTNLFGFVGAVRLKTKVVAKQLSKEDDDFGLPVGTVFSDSYVERNKITFSKRKTILRAGGGVEQKIMQHLKARASVHVEQTDRFSDITGEKQGAPDTTHKIKLKNSVHFGVGLFAEF